MKTPTCLIVTSEPLVGWALHSYLEQNLGFADCPVVDSAAAALDSQRARKPDLIILAGETGPGTLARLARELRRQRHGQAILVYDGALEAEYARGALEAGVRGWLTRRDDLAEVSQAVTAVLRGDLHLSRQAADRLAGIFSPRSNGASRSSGDLTRLSEREREVLNLMRGGLRGKEIAFRLGISPKTVETHQQRMREKLHVKSSADLANLAVT